MAVRQIVFFFPSSIWKKKIVLGHVSCHPAAVVGTLPFPGSRACPLPGESVNDRLSIIFVLAVYRAAIREASGAGFERWPPKPEEIRKLRFQRGPNHVSIDLKLSTSAGPGNYTCTTTATFLLNSALIQVIFSDFSSNSETPLHMHVCGNNAVLLIRIFRLAGSIIGQSWLRYHMEANNQA